MASKMDLVRRAVTLQRWRNGERLMRKSLSVALVLALAWVAFAERAFAADVPFKVLSAGKVRGAGGGGTD